MVVSKHLTPKTQFDDVVKFDFARKAFRTVAEHQHLHPTDYAQATYLKNVYKMSPKKKAKYSPNDGFRTVGQTKTRSPKTPPWAL